jgi:hypothetical protein
MANGALYDSSRETLTLFRLPFLTMELDCELLDCPFLSNLRTIQSYRTRF